jgi:hypothetical protein
VQSFSRAARSRAVSIAQGNPTYGGYSRSIVVDRHFVVKVPETLAQANFPGVAPLLCAGITTYSPLKAMGIKSGQVLGVRRVQTRPSSCCCLVASRHNSFLITPPPPPCSSSHLFRCTASEGWATWL